MATSILIGIAGGTGSGKTTIAKKIIEQIGTDNVVIIPQDAYYRDRNNLPVEEREKINYDHPSSFDISLLIKHLRQLGAGKDVPRLSYDYVSHTRKILSGKVPSKPVTILEGIMVLENENLRRMLDIKLYVDTDPDVRIIRRLRRDIHERGRSFENVIQQYLSSVRPMHLKFVAPSRRYADVIIPEGGYNKVAIDMVVSKIRTLLADLE
ncbi:uridine kinase [bacterium]|nr:uridine kinase [bacterium]